VTAPHDAAPGRRTTPPTGLWLELPLWCGAIALLELAGDRVTSDRLDLLVAALVASVVVLVHRFSRVTELIAVSTGRLGARVAALFDVGFGLDFHPQTWAKLRRFRRWRAVVLVVIAADLLLAALIGLAGSPIFAVLRSSYTLYLLVAVVTWAVAWQLVVALAIALVRDLDATPRGGRRRARGTMLTLAVGVLASLVVLVFLDTLAGAWGWMAALLVSLAILAPPRLGPRLDFALHVRATVGDRHRLMTMPAEELVRTQRGLMVLIGLAVCLMIQGHRLPIAGGDAIAAAGRLPLLDAAGLATTWAIAWMSLLWTLAYLFEATVKRRWTDPATAGPIDDDRAGVAALVASNVDLARQEPRPYGDGYLLAVHWWPADRLVRDAWPTPDPRASGAGPSFHQHYGQRARRSLRALLRPLEIDLVFVEDGVPSAQLPAVIALLHAFHDGGGRRLEDGDIGGIPGVTIAVDEIRPEVAESGDATAGGVPGADDGMQPGHARVLMILRLRGDDAGDGDGFSFSRDRGWVERLIDSLSGAPVA